MRGESHSVDRADLLARIREAERLVSLVEEMDQRGPTHPDYQLAIMRWAVVGDEVMTAMIRAEEMLDEQARASLREEVNAIDPADPARWARYRYSEPRYKAFTGKYLTDLSREADDDNQGEPQE